MVAGTEVVAGCREEAQGEGNLVSGVLCIANPTLLTGDLWSIISHTGNLGPAPPIQMQ
jgi:hypothetical protein